MERAPDVLGCAVRLRRDDLDTATAAEDDQDLLFATVRSPFGLPLSPFTTNVRDFLGNDYFAVAPFDAGVGRPVYFCLHPLRASGDRGGTRGWRLGREVERRTATLRLEIADRPHGPWLPLAIVRLERPSPVDGEALRFRPFQNGRDVRPQGFVHALRIGVYALSQLGRPGGRPT